MEKKLIPLIGLTLSLAVAGIMGFTLSGGSGAPAQDPAGQLEEPSGNRPPIRSDEGIDSEVCNYVHNISACDGNPTLEDPPLPTYEEWLRDHGTRGSETLLPVDSGQAVDTSDWKVVTSIDDIDPNICNAIHNINACSPEELGELGMIPITGSIAVGEYHPGVEVEGKPEPLFGDGKVQYESQSDCGSTEGPVYLSADGEFGCVVVHDFEDGGESEIKEQLPVMMPRVPALLVQ